ncbi:MAG: saccharopine dehydrogenase NADP-binding domain-containing protein [Bacteroidales bacterium]|jgi:saccharopine dehydrogenase (NAD+, L-lysine-forming)|nr:saccharopine dehydrogenase NADP-binding domain-containing protein [Bacteroidales bacterium]
MKKHIMVLGGYGGVGKVISENLLKHTTTDITIAGRNLEKAETVANRLRKEHPNRQIKTIYADATDRGSLIIALKNVDLVIVATTTPDHIGTIAETAIETDTDMIDILVRGDVVDKLTEFRENIVSKKRIFITQAGFHPGLPAPFIKYAKNKFDDYQTANVVMVMNSKFEKPESTHEIINEIGASNAKILKNSLWLKSSYKDALNIQFSEEFGVRKCYPLQMREVYPLEKELGIKNMGVYSAGFNAFVDNFVFPLTMLLQSIKKGMGTKLSGKLMHWGINKYYTGKPGVEFKLLAKGMKDGLYKDYVLECHSPDAFEFTSLALIACLNQYLDRTINIPGIYLMGNIVEETRIIDDLRKMGVQIRDN